MEVEPEEQLQHFAHLICFVQEQTCAHYFWKPLISEMGGLQGTGSHRTLPEQLTNFLKQKTMYT